MASANDSRRTYARRAHYGWFATYVITITAALGSGLLAVLSVLDPVGFSNLRLVAHEVTAPISRVFASGVDAVGGLDDSIGAWWMAGRQNQAMRSELAAARRQVIAAAGLAAENAELRRLLALTRGPVQPVAVTRILSTSATSSRRFAVIDAGRNAGVMPGQPVRSADGLIGRTLEVGPNVARVLMITDRQSLVPARRARDGLALLVSGRGDQWLDVRALNAASNPLKVGDIIQSSGSGGLYQPGTPLGIIIRLTNDGGLARPLADVGSANGVIVEPASDAGRDEPPPPAQTMPESGQ